MVADLVIGNDAPQRQAGEPGDVAPGRRVLRVGATDVRGDALERIDHVGREVLRVGARVRQQLVRVVEALRRRERALGGEAELRVGLALQAREVEQQLRLLDARALFDAHDLRVDSGTDGSRDRLGLVTRRRALARAVEPLAAVGLARLAGEVGDDLPVRHRDERLDLLVATCDERERRRLHAPNRNRVARRADLHGGGARRVVPDQPVCGLAGTGSCLERLHLFVVEQMVERVAQRALRHRREPGALDRLLDTSGLVDQLEDQLAFTPGVASVHDDVDVLALHRAMQHGELLDGAIATRLVLRRLRDDRQILELPTLVLGVIFVGLELLYEVPRGRAHDEVIALEQVAVLLERARQRADDVALDARLLADNQSLTHQRRGR